MAVIGFVLFGLVVGVIARLLVPGRQRMGLGLTVLLGIVGSVVGGIVATQLGTGKWTELNFLGAVVAIVTAVALIIVGERSMGRRGLR